MLPERKKKRWETRNDGLRKVQTIEKKLKGAKMSLWPIIVFKRDIYI
jgi:hypothetical protein